MRGHPASAVQYLSQGARLLIAPGLKRFIIVPLLVNIAVFVLATATLIHLFSDFLAFLMDWLPGWLEFLGWLLWAIFACAILLVYGYSFTIITNIIAAPFYGVLAEKIEHKLTGIAPPEESWGKLIPRTLGRELLKLWYFLTRGILILLLILASWFIPGLNLVVLIISSLWGAWCMAVQYIDYPADNHQTSFVRMRYLLNQAPLTSYSFGGITMLASIIPVVNIFAMPVAVAGATVYWVKDLKHIDASN